MKNFFKKYIYKSLFTFFFFFLLSLFFSINKILIPFIVSLFFFLTNSKIQKILTINLIVFIGLIKSFSLFLNMNNTLSKVIYEKHFLYGVRNLDNFYIKDKGDLTSFINVQTVPQNEKIKIKTDRFGFRNEQYNESFDYILVGDSFLHQVRLNQNELINYQLKKNNINSYNASLSVYDISHYFEIIKFFKEKKKIH